MDAKDILGVKPSGGAAAPGGRKPREDKGSKPRPKGISREVWQITAGYTAEAPPPPVVPTLGFKERRKPASKRTVRWDLKPFKNSGRTDNLELLHWVKRMEDGAVMKTPGSNGGDVGGDYAFSKYNKKIDMLEYNDVEWNVLGLAGGPDGSWGREETDYLMGLCRRFDLRWQVIADRYAFPTSEPAAKEAASEGPSEASTRSRSVDQLKARYYGLAHTLILSRSESVEQAAHKELVKNPYNASAEADRRDLLTGLLTRTTSAQVDEDALLAAAAQVEARRKSEVDGARQAGLPLQLLARPAAVPPGGADVGGAAAAVGGKAGAAGLGLALGRLTIPDITLSAADIDTEADPGGPDLPTPRGQSQRPSQGCYARAAHTAHCSAELVVLGGAGTQSKPRDRKAGESFNKRIDLAMEELGVKPPNTGTRAVCRAWYALRKEVAQLLELRSQLARKSKESAAAAAVVAGVAGQPFSPLGGVGSPRGGSYPQLLSSPHAAGQPSLAGGFGAAPGAAGLLSPMDGGDGGRAQKRKAAPRHGDDDAVAPRPKKKR